METSAIVIRSVIGLASHVARRLISGAPTPARAKDRRTRSGSVDGSKNLGGLDMPQSKILQPVKMTAVDLALVLK